MTPRGSFGQLKEDVGDHGSDDHEDHWLAKRHRPPLLAARDQQHRQENSHHISPGSDMSPQSPHPGPGVQLTGGNRQIRTTVLPLTRGVTPVIAGAGSGDGYLLVLQLGNTFWRSATPATVTLVP